LDRICALLWFQRDVITIAKLEDTRSAKKNKNDSEKVVNKVIKKKEGF